VAPAIGKYSVAIDGHRTSVSLEPEFWRVLKEIAAARGETLGALVTEVDRTRTGNLSSTLRVFVLTKIGETQPPPE
jgi:predicted DNA-binding ribbon-helix-helix protein